jgi:hypothetical protein
MAEEIYIPGPTVCGFHGMFERDFGDDTTPKPYARVTPSRVGGALLPFHCPSCEAVVDFSDPARREHHHDSRETASGKNDNYWCPSCSHRFYLNTKGKPFKGTIDEHVAPAEVETIAVGEDGMVNYKRITKAPRNPTTILGHFQNYILGTDILGCC